MAVPAEQAARLEVTRRGGRRLLLSGLVITLLLLRPLTQGISLRDSVGFWIFVLGVVVVPGMILCHVWGFFSGRGAQLVGQGATLGIAVHGLASFGALYVGRAWIGEVAPITLAAASVALSRLVRRPARAADEQPAEVSVPVGAGLLLLTAAVLLVQPLFSARGFWQPMPADLLFHVANAGEVRHRWPLQDPRVAGLPLSYHVFCYALPAAASRWTGLPVADTLLTLAPLLWISLSVLQVYHAGCVLFGDRRVGLIGAALVSFHADPGWLLGMGPGAFNSNLPTGLYRSPTTIVGFLFLTGIAVWIEPLLSARRFRVWSWVLLGVLGAAAAATKPSVPASVVGGLLFLIFWYRIRGCPGTGRAICAALLFLAAATPPALAASMTTRATDMFRWVPWTVVWTSGFVQQTQAAIFQGGTPSPLAGFLTRSVLAAVWALGYFGLAGLGLIAYLCLRPGRWTPGRIWAAGVFLTGAGLGFTLHAEGGSQLFFLYNGQVLLALFGAAGLLAAFTRARSKGLILALLAVLGLPSFDHVVRAVAGSIQSDLQLAGSRPALADDYATALAWLRAHAAPGQGVVFTSNPSLLLSALGECRVYYESGFYTQRGHRERWRGNAEPYPERVELQQRFLFRPDTAVAQLVLDQLPPGTIVRIVADAVLSRVEYGRIVTSIGSVPERRLFPSSLFELEFANRTMHVYRLKWPSEPLHGRSGRPPALISAALPP